MADELFAQLEAFVEVHEEELPTLERGGVPAPPPPPAPWGPGEFFKTPHPDVTGRLFTLLALPMKDAQPPVYRVVRPNTGLALKLLSHAELHHR